MFSIVKNISTFISRIFIIFLVFGAIFFLFLHFSTDKKIVSSQSGIAEKTRDELYQIINHPEIKKTSEGHIYITTVRIFTCKLVGEGCTDNPNDNEIYFAQSFYGNVSRYLVAPIANPPASGVYWAYSGLQNAGFIPQTYAYEGLGAAALTPFKSIWILFRNFVFMIMVFIVMAIGFMIMFRAKINPQTVISIENALPKIVMAMLYITFSYAIAGFLIDMMYVVIGFIVVLFSTNNNFGFNPRDLLNMYYFNNDSKIWNSLSPVANPGMLVTLSTAFYDIIPTVFAKVLDSIVLVFAFRPFLSLISSHYIFPVDTTAVGPFKPGETPRILNKSLQGLASLAAKAFKGLDSLQKGNTPGLSLVGSFGILFVEIIIAMLLGSLFSKMLILILLTLSLIYMYFRIFFMLLVSYLQIIILVMFAPIILAAEALPGRSTFGPWIKNLIMHLSTWPLFIMLTLVIKIILDTHVTGAAPVGGIGTGAQLTNYTAPLWRPPFLLNINPEAFRIIVAGGLFYMIPDFIKLFREIMGVKPLPISFNAGAFLQGGGAAVGGGFGVIQSVGSLALAANSIPALRGLLAKLPGFSQTQKELEESLKKGH